MVVEMDFVTVDFIMIIFVLNQNGQTEKKNHNPSLVLLRGPGKCGGGLYPARRP